MKNVYLIVGFFILLASACKEYDDIAQWNMANNQEQRLATLEELCSQINTNLQALHDLIGAFNNGDYILNVSPIQKEGVEIGYTITFAKSGTITIYHGKDGQKGEQGDSGEGIIPLIGIRQDLDGVHYWTLNNEWLLDESGKKVNASGNDGQNGKSAYELAQEKGYTGTLEEWLTTLKGETGNSGKTAYEIAVEKGYSGTETEWLETLKGNNGQTPKLKIENGRWLLSMDNGNTWEDIGKATGDNGQDATGGDSMFKKIDYTTSNEYVTFTLANNIELKLPKYGQDSSTGELSITFSETTDIEIMPLIDYNITYTIVGANPNTTIEVIGIDGFTAIIKSTSTTSGTIIITPPIVRPINKKVIVLISNGESLITMKTLTFQYKDNSPYIAFPDINFKTYLISNFDKNNDGEISYYEAEQVKEISCSYKDIQSLEGIQYFSNITALYCSNNKLNTLDISKLYKLEYLSCGNNSEGNHNQLTTLDVSRNIALKGLSCPGNKLTSLDVSNNVALTNLSCDINKITELNISNNIALTSLRCSFNKIKSLNAIRNTKLTDIVCNNNNLTALYVASNSALKYLRCDNNQLDEVAINNIYTNLPQGQTWNDGSFDRQSTIFTNNNLAIGDKTIATQKNWLVNP